MKVLVRLKTDGQLGFMRHDIRFQIEREASRMSPDKARVVELTQLLARVEREIRRRADARAAASQGAAQ